MGPREHIGWSAAEGPERLYLYPTDTSNTIPAIRQFIPVMSVMMEVVVVTAAVQLPQSAGRGSGGAGVKLVLRTTLVGRLWRGGRGGNGPCSNLSGTIPT
ncbi:hypothetical protein E2C01_082031 [Portunus trituberculatus]|uniref:Uncharacterized protein n=1 Tax=Portunus trituberculatus TaxID=210409 RepID=A0A5B7J2Q1_PORTR|nr:hypothetical protein [Portunus trituberculatus]